jgi:hypothetical protein
MQDRKRGGETLDGAASYHTTLVPCTTDAHVAVTSIRAYLVCAFVGRGAKELMISFFKHACIKAMCGSLGRWCGGQGCKEFFLVAPTAANLQAYEKWVQSSRQVGMLPYHQSILSR